MPDVWILPSGKLKNIESDPIENEIFEASQPILKIVFGRTGQSSLKFEEGFSPFSELLKLSRRSLIKMWKSEVNLRSNEAKDETRITWAADSARRSSGFWSARLKNSVFDLKIRIASDDDSDDEVKSDITSSTKSFKRSTLEPWKAWVCKFRSSELTKIWQDWLPDRIFSRWNFVFEGYKFDTFDKF